MTTGTVLLEFGEPTVPDEDLGVPVSHDDRLTVSGDPVEPTVAGIELDLDDSRPCTEAHDSPCLSCTSEP